MDRGYFVISIGGGYTLGPQIMNLESHMRSTDPFILAGQPVVEELAEDFGATAMISRVFRESFVSIYSVQSARDPRIRVARGRALTLALKDIKRRGSTKVFGEVRKNDNAVSAPLLDVSGTIEGAITLTAPKEMMSGETMAKAEERVRLCARPVCRQRQGVQASD